jgi:very-short-patch-repair endonuclease
MHARLFEGDDWRESHGDRAVLELAARQHGAVTTGQLAALGLSRQAITRRVAGGRFARLHRGVYLVGPLPAQFTREMAAVLACGDTAMLSHQSAAGIWGFGPHWQGDVHVTVQGHHPRQRRGIRVHRATPHPSLKAAVHHGLPLTTPARTLKDLAATLPQHHLDRAVEQAQLLRLVDADTLHRQGSSALTNALRHDPALTRSEAEARLLALIRAAQLPTPQTNTRIGRHEVDMVWHEQRVIVEVDGYEFHSSRQAFERDRLRDGDLQAAGYRVLRVTWRQIAHEPELVIARLAALLAIAVGSGHGRP